MLCFFKDSCVGSVKKVGLLKRRARSHVVRGEIKNCTLLWRKARFQVKMYKTPHGWSALWSSGVEKLHAAVAKSTFWSQNVKNWLEGPGALVEVLMSQKLHAAVAKSTFSSQNVQNTSWPERFLKFWCRKIRRRCGEKHILKSKCTKHLMAGALFEVLMSKNCTPLWRKAHFEVKMYKTPHGRSTFWSSDVKKLHAAVAKSTFWSQNVQNTSWPEHFLKFWCQKIARRCGEKHILKSKCTKHLMLGALFEVLMSKN